MNACYETITKIFPTSDKLMAGKPESIIVTNSRIKKRLPNSFLKIWNIIVNFNFFVVVVGIEEFLSLFSSYFNLKLEYR